jgi:7-cyano-7-deazaguanine synthase
MAMPTIKEVLGSPTPVTYVPNRNMILMSIAAAYAETRGVEYIVTGIQSTDQYGYWDTTASWAEKMNAVFSENRKIKIKLIAPFVSLSKANELQLLLELDGNVDLLTSTLTCYNPTDGLSCGKCPSCSERIAAFAKVGIKDPVPYSRDIHWNELFARMKK